MEYQTAVMRKDFDTADRVLPTVPKEQRTRVAHFLEKQGFKKQALAVSSGILIMPKINYHVNMYIFV